MNSPSRYEQAVVGYTNWLLRFPVLTVLLCLASVIALAYGAKFLTFSTDYRVYFSKDNPELKANDEIQNAYGRNDNVFVMFTPRQGDVFQPRVLEAVRTFTREAWKLPYATRVDSITNFQHTRADGDDLAVNALLADGASITAERIATMKAVTLNEPQLLRRLISPTGSVTAINVVTELPHKTEQEVPAVMQAARALRDRTLERYPEVEIALSGVNPINYAFTEASQGDMRTLIPAMNLLIVLATWVMLRSVWATMACLLLVTLSTVAAMGIAGYMRIGLTPPALAA
ncbi:MAG: MMPL family transporter, partial [Terriglobales bacterium]